MLLLVSSSWGTDKFPTGSSHPHRSQAQTGQAGHARSNATGSLPQKTQTERANEVRKLEHQNAMALQASSRQRSSKAAGQAPRNHREPTGRTSGINFSYHPPQTKTAGSSGNRKH